MLSKPVFGYARPKFNYELLSTVFPQPVTVSRPASATLLLPREMGPTPSTALKIGMRVRTGQRLTWDDAPGPAVASTFTGKITAIAPQLGDYGRKYTAITIATEARDEWDEAFPQACGQINLTTLADYLSGAPGAPRLDKLLNPKKPIETIIIYGGDTDLLVDSNLYVLKSQTAAVEKGIHVLKEATGVEKIILAVPGESFQNFDGHFAAEVRAVPNSYP
ncbi:MAG: hypothetical protein HZB87_06715, partial [Desulfatitalea sp.]|nr:hypothetical protein [Desulfatitalea sp.]